MTTTTNDENCVYIEEVEELPEINCVSEWEEFGNIQVQIDPIVAHTESSQRRKFKNVKKSLRKKSNVLNKKSTDSIVSVKPQDSVIKVTSTKYSASDGNALFDGTFFTFVAEYYVENLVTKGITRKFKGKCELCAGTVYIVGSGSSTFNFLRHLRRKHGQNVYEEYLAHKETKNAKPKSGVRQSKVSDKDKTIPMYVVEESTWKQFGNPRTKRPVSSIILNEGVSERILNDLNDFVLNSSWYQEKCIPCRRTYLFHGPSGCGKSSFVMALASELNFGICVLHASDRRLTDDKLNHLLNCAPEKCVILLEDIDVALSRGEKHNQLTTSGILNCLDGVTAPEERIIFVTCTDISRLDPVLLRPGRIDVKEHFGYCSRTQIVLMFQKFYSDSSSALEFSQEVLKYEKPLTPAQLQGFFLARKRDSVELLKLDVAHIWD